MYYSASGRLLGRTNTPRMSCLAAQYVIVLGGSIDHLFPSGRALTWGVLYLYSSIL